MSQYCEKTVILIEGSKLNDDAMFILEAYRKIYKNTRKSLLRRSDYLRWSYVLDMIENDVSILDVGVGAGQFVNMLSISEKPLTSISGLDLSPHTGFVKMFDNIDMHYHSVTKSTFPDGHFDTVTCLEVIEHLKDKDVIAALSELRRISKKRLIVSVPFSEQEPLPKHHIQSFNFARLSKLFPEGHFTFFSLKNSMAWVVIEENYDKATKKGAKSKNIRQKTSNLRRRIGL